jgi:hypothetical protein
MAMPERLLPIVEEAAMARDRSGPSATSPPDKHPDAWGQHVAGAVEPGQPWLTSPELNRDDRTA